MSVVAEEIQNLIKLYHFELMGHLNVLLAGDIDLYKTILDRRRQLDIEIRNLLMVKVGKNKNH